MARVCRKICSSASSIHSFRSSPPDRPLKVDLVWVYALRCGLSKCIAEPFGRRMQRPDCASLSTFLIAVRPPPKVDGKMLASKTQGKKQPRLRDDRCK